MPKYSVVIPVYNEEANIPELWRRLDEVLMKLTGGSEVLFVDDRSTSRRM